MAFDREIGFSGFPLYDVSFALPGIEAIDIIRALNAPERTLTDAAINGSKTLTEGIDNTIVFASHATRGATTSGHGTARSRTTNTWGRRTRSNEPSALIDGGGKRPG